MQWEFDSILLSVSVWVNCCNRLKCTDASCGLSTQHESARLGGTASLLTCLVFLLGKLQLMGVALH